MGDEGRRERGMREKYSSSCSAIIFTQIKAICGYCTHVVGWLLTIPGLIIHKYVIHLVTIYVVSV